MFHVVADGAFKPADTSYSFAIPLMLYKALAPYELKPAMDEDA